MKGATELPLVDGHLKSANNERINLPYLLRNNFTCK